MYGLPNTTVSPRADHHHSTTFSGGEYCSATTDQYHEINNNRLMLQRSIKTLSLQNTNYINNNNNTFISSHFPSDPSVTLDFLDIIDSSSHFRRVFSTGDLHFQNGQKAESPLSSESSMIIESMSKACKYSPEEKKERIERYRSKRNLRNFNKKIQYACRKSLADSRPRIRGRFARNDETEKNPKLQWSNNMMSGEEEDDDYDHEENWVKFLDAFSANTSFP